MIFRIYVAKKPEYAVESYNLLQEINSFLAINASDLKIFNRYDVEGLEKEYLEQAKALIFSEVPLDNVFEDKLPELQGYRTITVESLAGQFDQRADSASAGLQLLTSGERLAVKCAKVYAFAGINDADEEKIKAYLINPVESRQAEESKPTTLRLNYADAEKVAAIDSFIDWTEKELEQFYQEESFAMAFADLKFVYSYFKGEKRNPTVAELKVIDTYWSDHCRHTTFNSKLADIEIDSNNEHIYKAFELYEQLFEKHNSKRKDKYYSLMDIATIGIKELSEQGFLDNLDVSDEINACSVKVDVDVDDKIEEWLIMFKNETHNHPTEIEPFGGANTCLGGAIRDPLSGRVYVYQAMRITGSADPRESYKDTLKGKLPQRVITTKAAEGYSSYGNQIGVPAGLVAEVYHKGFKAKRLEAGYVIGGAPKKNVVREKPKSGDTVILLGGTTGRDGCGGATGSSKAHDHESIQACSAEVQKGNPLIERNIQRLFRNKQAANLIIKCNDFGAGGVSVAVGELADSLDINLDLVPTKYQGLNGLELAISESQERMAVVVGKDDSEEFIALAKKENLNAVEIAKVTRSGRMRMFWNGEIIVDLARDFLDSNGVLQEVSAKIQDNTDIATYFPVISDDVLSSPKDAILKELASLKNCSQKGLGQMFDATVGASTVLMPYGGSRGLTPSMIMASKPPVEGNTNTVTASSFGYPINLLAASPFVGSIYSIVLSINKLVASGIPLASIRMSFQEYFMALGKDKLRWGQPLAALLAALYAQINLHVASIGGKDSMSGSFNELDVPPSLISFAMGIGNSKTLISNVFNKGEKIYLLKLKRDDNFVPDFKYLNKLYALINANIEMGNVTAAAVVENTAISTLATSLLGEGVGFAFAKVDKDLFSPAYGDFILAIQDIDKFSLAKTEYLGVTNDTGILSGGNFEVTVKELERAYTSTLASIFPIEPTVKDTDGQAANICFDSKEIYKAKTLLAKPRVFIPVFPGTNGEYDLARAFENAGAEVKELVIKNNSSADVAESIEAISKVLAETEILAFAGGLSGGGEPDGTAKFITALFSHNKIKDALLELMQNKDGLIFGVGEGFKALLKLGLLPFGDMRGETVDSPTLAPNTIGRHISSIVLARIASNKGAWLSGLKVGDVFSTPVSHAEGRFVCNKDMLSQLIASGQVASQYVDMVGRATLSYPHNPNGSVMGIEGLISPDGRVFGKMGHSERMGTNLYKNVPGNYDIKIFENGVKYYK